MNDKKFLDYEGLETLVDIIKSTYAEQDDLTAVSSVATNAAAAVTSLNSSKQDKLIAGDNITIGGDGKTISAAATSYEDATQSTHGLMSTTDKIKLDGIDSGAEVNAISSIKVNGTTQTISNKTVDITVPTDTSDLTNGAGFITDASYVHVTVDDEIDSTSENPVQNKVIAEALDDKLDVSLKGANSGLAELDASGKVPSSQLPSFVDDVIEVNNYASLPATGDTGKIYITLDDNKTYRWSGSTYVAIGGGGDLVLGETSSTAYRGDRGKIAYDHSQDANKISTATPAGLYKVGVTAEGHVSTLTSITKEDITALGVPGIDTLYELSTTEDALKLYGGSQATTTEVPIANTYQIDAVFFEPEEGMNFDMTLFDYDEDHNYWIVDENTVGWPDNLDSSNIANALSNQSDFDFINERGELMTTEISTPRTTATNIFASIGDNRYIEVGIDSETGDYTYIKTGFQQIN